MKLAAAVSHIFFSRPFRFWSLFVGFAVSLLAVFTFFQSGGRVAKADSIIANVAVGFEPQAVVVNPVTNDIYVANYFSGNATIVDGTNNSTATVGDGSLPVPVGVCATTVSYTGPAVPIPDVTSAGVNINLPVSGVGIVNDLNFRFDTAGACNATVGNANAAVDHTFIGDLTFKLTSPGGTAVTFQSRRGGTRENICLTNLNDEGGFPNIATLTSITGSPESGNFNPETTGLLGMFDGVNANGTWVLNVSDNAGLDTGSMRRFSLIFNSGNFSSEGLCSSPTATNTPTATATSTPTSTNTPTATATSTPIGAAISGTVTYGNAIPATTRFVSNVLISGAGMIPVAGLTGGLGSTEGQYLLVGFGAGAYTVMPTKTGGVNGAISSFDAGRIALHVAGPPNPQLSGNQLIVADVSGNGSISSLDAGMIAKFVAGPPYVAPGIGRTGTWRFIPVNRNYPSVVSILMGEDYSALLIGEVSGNWTNNGARPVGSGQSENEDAYAGGSTDLAENEAGIPVGPERGIAVELPDVSVDVGKEVVIPVNVQSVSDKGVISYEFDLRYDPSVIQLVGDGVDLKETLSRGIAVVTNTTELGILRVVVYGVKPIDQNGVLLNLRFTAVGAVGSVSPISFERIMFNEGEPRVVVTDGAIEIF